jgi:hypothetical protein
MTSTMSHISVCVIPLVSCMFEIMSEGLAGRTSAASSQMETRASSIAYASHRTPSRLLRQDPKNKYDLPDVKLAEALDDRERSGVLRVFGP